MVFIQCYYKILFTLLAKECFNHFQWAPSLGFFHFVKMNFMSRQSNPFHGIAIWCKKKKIFLGSPQQIWNRGCSFALFTIKNFWQCIPTTPPRTTSALWAFNKCSPPTPKIKLKVKSYMVNTYLGMRTYLSYLVDLRLICSDNLAWLESGNHA